MANPDLKQSLEKRIRIDDPEARARIRAIGHCEYCGKLGQHVRLECAHIHGKGAGGDDTDDNMVCLCVGCHRTGPVSHHGGQIKSDELRMIALARVARQKAILDFGAIDCPGCFQKAGVIDEGSYLTCHNCGAVLLRYSPAAGS